MWYPNQNLMVYFIDTKKETLKSDHKENVLNETIKSYCANKVKNVFI